MVARRDWLVLLSCVAAAAGFIAVWQLSAHLPGGFDVYMHYYPNMEYAARQVLDGGLESAGAAGDGNEPADGLGCALGT